MGEGSLSSSSCNMWSRGLKKIREERSRSRRRLRKMPIRQDAERNRQHLIQWNLRLIFFFSLYTWMKHWLTKCHKKFKKKLQQHMRFKVCLYNLRNAGQILPTESTHRTEKKKNVKGRPTESSSAGQKTGSQFP